MLSQEIELEHMKDSTSLSIAPVSTLSGARSAFLRTRDYLSEQIIGQEALVERLHDRAPGGWASAGRRSPGARQDARHQGAWHDASRATSSASQFTPDMLPADLTGSDIYRPEEGSFKFQRGPLFHNLILADEINRAPAKVQSALLEAMAERQISVGQASYKLPPLFLVMATQNPIEQEGTYPLPEAQIDRFMLHVAVDYPDRATTLKIMRLARHEAITQIELPPPAIRLQQARSVCGATRDEHAHPLRCRRRIYCRLGRRDPAARALQPGAAPVAALGREPARGDRHGAGRARARLARRARFRDTRGRSKHRAGRLAPPLAARLRRPGAWHHRADVHRGAAAPGARAVKLPDLEELLALRGAARSFELAGARTGAGAVAGLSPQRPSRPRTWNSRKCDPTSAGDDPRSIDWRVTARRGRVHTKLYREERERPVWLLVDLGTGMFFGSRAQLKSMVAVRAAALLAWVAALGGRSGRRRDGQRGRDPCAAAALARGGRAAALEQPRRAATALAG